MVINNDYKDFQTEEVSPENGSVSKVTFDRNSLTSNIKVLSLKTAG